MKKSLLVSAATVMVLAGMLVCTAIDAGRFAHAEKTTPRDTYGSDDNDCRKCHKRFCVFWSRSPHGLSMQPFTEKVARDLPSPLIRDMIIGKNRYQVDISRNEGYIIEKGGLLWGGTRYPITNVLGGKNDLYFLTPLERGRLQILPLAYDAGNKEWFDVTTDGFMHEKKGSAEWKDSSYTLKSSCYGCHVNRLSTNYDQKNDLYRFEALTPGIQCESCHGPTTGHTDLFKGAEKEGDRPGDMKIMSFKKLAPGQVNHTCAACHAKATPITSDYVPAEDFFDHYDLAALEDHDFFVDGSDKGPNHIYTRWLMNPCAREGHLDCLKCHTAGGEYRYPGAQKANNACLPCHAERVRNAAGHTHHKPQGSGGMCISCHMPKITDGRTQRTDHSMLPPMPAVSAVHATPNACNICHAEKDASWAHRHVRKWYITDYQAPMLKQASLIDAARRQDWSRLSDMLAYIKNHDVDEVFTASLIRMLAHYPDPKVVAVFVSALDDPSPLVRSAAAEALAPAAREKKIKALLAATSDPVRLVRIKAASVLARYPIKDLDESEMKNLERATVEYIASMMVQPDQWVSHYNMGNYFLDRGENKDALLAYETAINIEPEAVPAYVGSSQAYSGIKNMTKAEFMLNKALKLDPDNAAAHYQMGILRRNQGNAKMAEVSFRAAMKFDPSMASAAYYLCLTLSEDRLKEAVAWGQKAFQMYPDARYGYTLATLFRKDGNWDASLSVLKQIISTDGSFADAYLLMGEIYENRGKKRDARAVYLKGLSAQDMSEVQRNKIQFRLNRLDR